MTIASALATDGPALALTVGVEALVVFVMSFPLRLAWPPAVAASVAINLLTQPTLWVIMVNGSVADPGGYWATLGLGETVVWLVEAGLYLALLAELRRQPGALVKALVLSFAANAASAGVALALAI
jgi:hypothetical protein